MSPSRRRWLMVAFAFLATLINYLDRQALSVASPVLREQFHMTNTAYARVLFAFLLAYTIMNGVSGPLIDRLGTRAGYALCMAWWSVAALLHAFARGAMSLGVFRFLLGLGEAGNWPAAIRLVAELFPAKERALASGIFNSGASVGAIVAPPVVAYVLIHWGWQAAFVAVGISGLIWLAFWWPVYQTTEQRDEDVPRGPGGSPHDAPIPVLKLLSNRFVLAFTFSKIFFDPVWYFYTFWFPEYLKQARHFDIASIGAFAWIPFAVAGFGNIFGGWFSGALLRRGLSVTVARKGSVTFFAALMMAAIPAVLAPEAWQSIAFASIAMMGYTGGLASMLTIPSDVFPNHAVASVYGIASMGSGFGGMVFTLITGWAVDRYSFTPVFFGFAFLPLICALILWTLAGPLRREAEPGLAT